MWLAFTIQIPLFTILIERVKIQENQKPAVLRLGKAFESNGTIPSGRTVFIRAAARINYETESVRRWNYSEPMEVLVP